MENQLISVIVPVYNVEEYLKQCLDSILEQTFSNYEVILVNDGSTDSSGLICQEYAEKDARIRYFEKENGGLSDARNYGIEQAQGEYLTFVDSDDFLDASHLTILYNALVMMQISPSQTMLIIKPPLRLSIFIHLENIMKKLILQKN